MTSRNSRALAAALVAGALVASAAGAARAQFT
jgi:hypothetical protein